MNNVNRNLIFEHCKPQVDFDNNKIEQPYEFFFLQFCMFGVHVNSGNIEIKGIKISVLMIIYWDD